MNNLYITTTIIPRLCFLILFAVALGYLLSLKRKSAATWWLIAFCAILGLDDLGWELYSLIPMTQMSPGIHHLMFIFGQGLLIPLGLSYVQFAYTFRGNPYPRESRIVLWMGGALAILALLLIVGIPAYVFKPILMVVQVGILATTLLLCFWSARIFLRKTLLFSRDALALKTAPDTPELAITTWDHLRAPQSRSARACRAFFWITILFVCMIGIGVLIWGLLLFAEFGEFLFNAVYLFFLFGMLVTYVNYAPEPTTVQVKLVGATLVTVVVIFVLIARMLFSDAQMLAESDLSAPPPHTLRFEPDGQGGYRATPLPVQWDPIFGDTLSLANDAYTEVSLPFAFPFYGDVRRDLYISDNGLVALTAPTHNQLVFSTWPLFHTYPFIAPLGIDLDPTQGGAVFYKTTPEAATVTWHEIPLHDGTARFTAQLVLYPTGTTAFSYQTPHNAPVATIPLRLGLRGLYPGGPNAPRQALPRKPEGVVRGAPGVALVEDYMTKFFQYQEEKGLPLFMLILSSSLFILFVFPYFFRYSLLKPLERLLAGVREVEAGDTDTVVAVEAEDEIGTLTQHFNGMTYAVREANTRLQAYAETLEEKVEARTAALRQSLDELKTTQAQLVQQEKMASLGSLTAGIAHEIKNPLNFVNNFASLSRELVEELDHETDPEERQAILADLKLNAEKIEEHGKRADAIVRSMLDHSRGSSGERRTVDLNTLVKEYVDLAYHGKRAQLPDFNATIEKNLDSEIGTVEVIPQDLGRVMLNLIGNAFDAIYAKSAQVNGQYTPTVTVSTQRLEDQVEIRVEDNGPGIAENVKAKIFEPFFTTKPTGSGTGLGLSLSYDIVTQGHGGTLMVESNEGQGATFVIRLPASLSDNATER